MRAVRIVIGAVVALAISLLGVAGAVGAAAAPSPSTSPYPPTCFLIKLSTTTPNPGETITINGQDFTPNVDVSIVFDTSTVLATTHADGNGVFAVDVTMPAGVTGSHTIRATGDPRVASGDCPSGVVQILIGTQPTTSGGGLASTGVDIMLAVAVALVLLGAGVVLTRSGRRRRHHSVR